MGIDYLKEFGVKLAGMPQYNVLWGFLVQITMVATWAGDGFNPSGLLCSTPMGYKRLPKIMLLVASIYLTAFGLQALCIHLYVDVCVCVCVCMCVCVCVCVCV